MNSKGNRRPDAWLGEIHYQVTGDGHREIGHSGVGISAIGYRLRDPGS
jgi:hypothetical protein